MDQSPEEKKTRLFNEALSDIGEDNIAQLSERGQAKLESYLKFHIGLRVDYEAERDAKMKAILDKEKYMKITSLVFARWVLELFKNIILGQVDSRIINKPNASLIKEAWKKFLTNTCRQKEVVDAYATMLNLIPNYPAISSEVQRIISTPGNQGTIDDRNWIAKRSIELYFKYSDIIHNLKRINWNLNEDLDIILSFLPNAKQHDNDLISILHAVILPLIPTNTAVAIDDP